MLKFAVDGVGWRYARLAGTFLDNAVAQCLFMLLIMFISKGWTITVPELTRRVKFVTVTLWLVYTLTYCLFFTWNQVGRLLPASAALGVSL